MNRELQALLLLSVASLTTACGRDSDPSSDSASPLSVYGPHEEAVLGAPVSIEPVRGGLRLAARDARPSRPSVTLDDAGRCEIRFADGTVLRVRERGALGAPSPLRGTIGWRREDGRAYWSAAGGAVEEWIDVDAGLAHGDAPVVTWEIENGSVRAGEWGIDVLDAAGVARARVTAPSAWAADGEAVPVRLAVEDGLLALYADADGRRVLVDPVWTPTGVMPDVWTAGETADPIAVLPDAVFVVGARHAGGFEQKRAVRYDIGTSLWSPAPSLIVERSGHTISVLPDGRLLAVGSLLTGRVERFDPAAMEWTEVAPTRAGRRWQHTATELTDGTVLVSGGWSGTMPVTAAERYEPTTDTWRSAGTLNHGRFWHTATRLLDGRVLVAGGSQQDGLTATAEIFDPGTNTWAVVASLSLARCRHRAALLPDGRVLVVGGLSTLGRTTSAEIYDVTSNRWTPTGGLAAPRDYHTATSLPDGTVLVAGGVGLSEVGMASTEIYVPATGSFRAGPSMTQGRSDHAAALLPGGRVIVVGGRGDRVSLSSSEILVEDACGNGTLDSGEGCDDGNRQNGDCCSALCRIEVAGTLCRPGAACDAAEVCDGVTAACPPDVLAPAGIECRPAVGLCDAAEECTGTSADCPEDGFAPSGVECRAAADICDVTEHCTGTSAACPRDAFVSTGTECRAATGVCDVAERCSGASAACPADVLAPNGTECRAAAGPCDVAETCSGSSASCGDDAFAGAAIVCRAQRGDCDIAERCAGIGAACPDDVLVPAATECRAAGDTCDVAELCSGLDPFCPVNAFAAAGAECRSAANECDSPELCTGTSAVCPLDSARAEGSVCGPNATEACDVPDACVGVVGASARCVARVATSGTPCGTARCASGVESESRCDGASLACPPAAERACEPFACGESRCLVRCSTDEHCAAGYECDGEGCVPEAPDSGMQVLDAALVADAGVPVDASDDELDAGFDAASINTDASLDPPAPTSSCGCRATGSRSRSAPVALLFGALTLLARRRRRSADAPVTRSPSSAPGS
ncbi:kelch repeat-containing protein [Sandaracinus amylolyticus]|uniref:kelch repeat-containing protein n=1 Tax=Sandaracinus amylolyticus TaxID=927083 RepID=UPI001F1D416F|nr:kelch repeat-containing protein [Sandaracinus amylolyticus]